MPTVDFETSISDFLALGRRLQALQSLTGGRVLDEITIWYHDNRIIEAAVEDSEDMLLLQWGVAWPYNISEPTDLRKLDDNQVVDFHTDFRYLDFTRQVFPSGGDRNADFDSSAVQMSITLYYDPATGDEPSSNLWIDKPDDIARGTSEFCLVPFVSALLTTPAQRAAIYVGYCG